MINDLIYELGVIDDRLIPTDVKFSFIDKGLNSICLIYHNCIKVRIYDDRRFVIYTFDKDKIEHHCIYDTKYTEVLDLIISLYNNKDKITEILLKYI